MASQDTAPTLEPGVHSAARMQLRRWAPRTLIIVVVVLIAAGAFAAGGVWWGKAQVPAPATASATPSESPRPAIDMPGSIMIRTLLQRAAAGDASYKAYLNLSTGIVFTPLDASSVSWDRRGKDGSASVSFASLTDKQWASLLESLTVGGTVVPQTLQVTKVTTDDPDSKAWGFEFTMRTTAGKTLTGRALGRGSATQGYVERLSYGVDG